MNENQRKITCPPDEVSPYKVSRTKSHRTNFRYTVRDIKICWPRVLWVQGGRPWLHTGLIRRSFFLIKRHGSNKKEQPDSIMLIFFWVEWVLNGWLRRVYSMRLQPNLKKGVHCKSYICNKTRLCEMWIEKWLFSVVVNLLVEPLYSLLDPRTCYLLLETAHTYLG